jgi:hypothetical protein
VAQFWGKFVGHPAKNCEGKKTQKKMDLQDSSDSVTESDFEEELSDLDELPELVESDDDSDSEDDDDFGVSEAALNAGLARAAAVDRAQRRASGAGLAPPRVTREERRQAARLVPPPIEDCTWVKEASCCKKLKCSDSGSPALVQTIRAHCKRLERSDRRDFVKARVEVLDVDPAAKDSRGRKRKKDVKRQFYVDASPDTVELPVSDLTVNMLEKCCQSWFLFATGVSTTTIYQPHVAAKRMQSDLPAPARSSPKENAVLFWLLAYAKYYQVSPDSELTALPFATKKVVHDLYLDERSEMELPFVSYERFAEVWRKRDELENIVLRKYLRFAKCDGCVGFRTERAKTRDPKTLEDIRRREWKHKLMVKGERGSYWVRRKRATVEPKAYTSVIVDGADQKDFGAPHFREIDHLAQGAHRIPVKIMGVLVHGIGAWAYTHLDHVKQGTNATVDCLVRTLVKVKEKQGFLGRKLYLQLDNTVKQCKSRYMCGFLAMLVEHGVFREIVLSFLPVGHTHEVSCCYHTFFFCVFVIL